MCSRFELNTSPRELARQFSLSSVPTMPNHRETRPTDNALVIFEGINTGLRIWGIPAPWDGKPVFNARAETVLEKPIFLAYLAKRCIIPATSFPEWRKDGKTRHRYDICLRADDDGNPGIMAFAGLMDDSHATIITCPAAPRMAHVHGRMPVILSGNDVSVWLDGAPTTEHMALLVPYSSDDLEVIEQEPVPPAQPDLFA